MTSPSSPIPFALPDITEAEIDAVTAVLRSRWITTGSVTREFEERFAESVGAPHAIALNSCTAALHLSLEAFGVGPGDAVFLPTYTFAATGEVVRYLGAEPVLVDVDPVTACISIPALRQAIESTVEQGSFKPRAVMPVHFAGVAVDMDGIWALAREFGLVVVEDAAHAFPATYGERSVGAMPEDIEGTACFSFYATKTITTGEGGMVTTADPEVADRIRLMSLHGLSKQAWNRYAGGTWRYDIVEAGYKYNLTDIASAIGLAQLERAEAMAKRRAEIATAYLDAFRELSQFELPQWPSDRKHAWHLFVLRLAGGWDTSVRDEVIRSLQADHGIGCSVHFIPLHLHSYYRERFGFEPGDFPGAMAAFDRCLSLPIYSGMSDDDVQRVIEGVRAVHAGLGDRP